MTGTIRREAVLSKDGRYRYALRRSGWAGDARVMSFIMLNPSTADAEIDDPTIRRCMAFAKREGCHALSVANLFAYRATNPAELNDARMVDDIVGPDNDLALDIAAHTGGGPVVVAWGATVDSLGLTGTKAVARAVEALQGAGATLSCLGTTKKGHPRHPLYLKADTPLIPWSPA